jgi:polyhydroxyalkanoate synthesis regulator phasin
LNDAVQKYLQAATGLTTLTKTKAEQIAKQLVKQGEAATDNVGELVDDLLERQRKNREAVTALVKAETQRAVRAMGLATTTEVERLQKQVADLKRELAKAESKAAAGGAKKSTRTSAKKTTKKASTPAGTAAKKTTAKKASTKRSNAKKSSS